MSYASTQQEDSNTEVRDPTMTWAAQHQVMQSHDDKMSTTQNKGINER